MFVGSMSALDYNHKLKKNLRKTESSMHKVSSGKRINKAADDAAGVTISEGLRAQARGLSRGQRNSQEAMSMLQTVDGALGEITNQLHRMKEIAVEASNGTNTDIDRECIDKEFEEIKNAIQGIVDTSEFNGIKLLNGNKSLTIQTKDNPYTEYTLNLYDTNNSKIGIDVLSVNTQSEAFNALSKIDEAVNMVVKNRVNNGIDLNNIQHDFNNAGIAEENTTSSLSKIEDIDMATSMMDFVKGQVISNYSQSMFITANKSINYIANLLK